MNTGLLKTVRKISIVSRMAILLCLLFLSACKYHPPAPIDEHSSGIVKRQLNSDGSYYVRSGDTLYAIAFGYGLDFKDVAAWNRISSPYTIYPGQKLQLIAPAGRRGSGSTSGVQINTVKSPGQTTTKTVKSSGSSSSKPVAAKTAAAKPVTSKPVPVKSSPSPTSASTSSAKTPVKPPASTTADPKSWKWPTNGRVVRAYVAGNPARNGLDIAGKEGQAISASSGGQVVYSGNGLIGYGELIIIKHSEKMLSAYAHNKVRLVKEGDSVTTGQTIAEMGRNSGNEQLLHFEIRVHGKPVNPLTYLPKR
jgi:lipoprotein NlpD